MRFFRLFREIWKKCFRRNLISNCITINHISKVSEDFFFNKTLKSHKFFLWHFERPARRTDGPGKRYDSFNRVWAGWCQISPGFGGLVKIRTRACRANWEAAGPWTIKPARCRTLVQTAVSHWLTDLKNYATSSKRENGTSQMSLRLENTYLQLMHHWCKEKYYKKIRFERHLITHFHSISIINIQRLPFFLSG